MALQKHTCWALCWRGRRKARWPKPGRGKAEIPITLQISLCWSTAGLLKPLYFLTTGIHRWALQTCAEWGKWQQLQLPGKGRDVPGHVKGSNGVHPWRSGGLLLEGKALWWTHGSYSSEEPEIKRTWVLAGLGDSSPPFARDGSREVKRNDVKAYLSP